MRLVHLFRHAELPASKDAVSFDDICLDLGWERAGTLR